MPDSEITGLTENTTPATTDLLVIEDDPGGTPLTQKITLENLLKVINGLTADGTPDTAADYLLSYDASAGTVKKVLMNLVGGSGGGSNSICDGRLTLATATPVTTTDQAAKTTVYFTPYVGSKIALYDGSSAWDVINFTEISVAVPSTTNTPFDIFCYNNGGTPTLETVNWTNDTTRATALTKQDGVYVKTGATTRRYLGTGRTTGVSGQTEDSLTKRFLWNYYNRVPRALAKFESTNTWTTSTTTWHSANGSTANRVEIVTGVAEAPLLIEVMGMASHNVANNYAFVGIGEDTATANSASTMGTVYLMGNDANYVMPAGAKIVKYPAIGYHYYQWVQITQAATATFYGNDGAGLRQSGITGTIAG